MISSQTLFTFDKQHFIPENGEKLVKCKVCNCSYKHEFSLKRHFLRTHVNRSYIPDSERTMLDIVIGTHHKQEATPRMFSCNVCSLLFANDSDLTQHIAKLHQIQKSRSSGPESLSMKCSECEALFANSKSLMCHMRCHSKTASTKPSSTNVTKQTEVEGTTSSHSPKQKSRTLRERTSAQSAVTMFTCTICLKAFHSYGNMLRHRRLSHESLIKKRSGPPKTITKRKPRKSNLCNPKAARLFYNNIATNIAFNVKNCMHGNEEHLKVSQAYIQSYPEIVDMSDIKPRQRIDRKTADQCNIKYLSADTALRQQQKTVRAKSGLSKSKRERAKHEEEDGGERTEPAIYDLPGQWKFLCLNCLQYFPNTLELFTHQDSVHKRVKKIHMEVGQQYELPLAAIWPTRPIGTLGVDAASHVIGQPKQYTCTRCQNKFREVADLHSHLVVCGQDILKPIKIEIPPLVLPDSGEYGKVKSNKKTHWDRGGNSQQKKITEMDGFRVKKRAKSRLELEAEAQAALEARIRQAEDLSPTPSPVKRSEPLTAVAPQRKRGRPLKAMPVESTVIKGQGNFTCSYCSLTFKYGKTFQRHIQTKCEMMKMVTSPRHDDISYKIKEPPSMPNRLPALRQQIDGPSILKPVETSVTADTTMRPKLDSLLIDLDSFSPQQSQAQARVLAKFIHPARVCGPCFSCKKPNMARRYTHLQQRSESFRRFVLAKKPNLTLQSCICKACELNFRNQYDRRKNARSVMRSPRQLKPVSRSQSLPAVAVLDDSPPKNSKRGRPSKAELLRRAREALPRVSPIPRRVGPSRLQSAQPHSARELSAHKAARREWGRDPSAATDGIIELELKELCSQLDTEQRSPVRRALAQTVASYTRSGRAPRPNNFSLDSVEMDARLQVILRFVESSPPYPSKSACKRSSLTEIIDAVTRKIKKDPSSAKTLTDAINAAAAARSSAQSLPRVRKRGSDPLTVDDNHPRESISLPCTLDTESSTSLDGIKVRRIRSPMRPAKRERALISLSPASEMGLLGSEIFAESSTHGTCLSHLPASEVISATGMSSRREHGLELPPSPAKSGGDNSNDSGTCSENGETGSSWKRNDCLSSIIDKLCQNNSILSESPDSGIHS